MADEAVKINVSIDPAQAKSGAAAAKQAVESVGQAADAAGQAGQAAGQAGKGMEELGKGTGKAGAEMFDFHKKGEKLVKEMLGILNPSLAQGADFALDLAEGIVKLNGALLAMAGVGAAVGVLVAIFMQVSNSIEEARKKLDEFRKEQRESRGEAAVGTADVAKRMAEAGVFGPETATRVSEAFNSEKLRGVKGFEDATLSAMIAQEAFGLSDEQREQLLAGLVRAGGKAFDFGGEPKKVRKTLDDVLKIGAERESRQALDMLRLTAQPSAADAIDTRAFGREQRDQYEIDAELLRLRKQGEIKSDAELDLLDRMRRMSSVDELTGLFGFWQRGFFNDRGYVDPQKLSRMVPKGSDKTVGELLTLIQQATESAILTRGEQENAGELRLPPIRFEKNTQTTNIGTLNQRLGDPPAFNPSLAAHEGID